jgi:hypothetical protein
MTDREDASCQQAALVTYLRLQAFEGSPHHMKVSVDGLQEMVGWIPHERAGVVCRCKELRHPIASTAKTCQYSLEK